MNIREAKEQIEHAVKLYLEKDEKGRYIIPTEKQRPVFLMGAPGIGKTAIMEQVAQELGVALVSYTMTHHTRQSALGLPYIVEKGYVKESFFWMRSIVYLRLWRRRCFSSYSTRHLDSTKCLRDGLS